MDILTQIDHPEGKIELFGEYLVDFAKNLPGRIFAHCGSTADAIRHYANQIAFFINVRTQDGVFHHEYLPALVGQNLVKNKLEAMCFKGQLHCIWGPALKRYNFGGLDAYYFIHGIEVSKAFHDADPPTDPVELVVEAIKHHVMKYGLLRPAIQNHLKTQMAKVGFDISPILDAIASTYEFRPEKKPIWLDLRGQKVQVKAITQPHFDLHYPHFTPENMADKYKK